MTRNKVIEKEITEIHKKQEEIINKFNRLIDIVWDIQKRCNKNFKELQERGYFSHSLLSGRCLQDLGESPKYDKDVEKKIH